MSNLNSGSFLSDNADEKLVKVLEYFLSLHEADEIFNMIFDESFNVADVLTKLEEFHFQSGDPDGVYYLPDNPDELAKAIKNSIWHK